MARTLVRSAPLCLLCVVIVSVLGCGVEPLDDGLPAASEVRQQEVAATQHSGQATGASVEVGALALVISETGPLPAEGGALEASLLDPNVPGVLSAAIVRAATVGGGGDVGSEASTSDLTLTVGGHIITSGTLYSLAQTSCGTTIPSASASSIVENLTVDGVNITVTGMPNQVIALPVGAIILNAQATNTGATNADASATALRVLIPDIADIAIASSDAGVTCVYHETACIDGVDDDGDGDVDCDDSDCQDAPNCQPETVCDDGLDNDGDGPIDCADSDCAAAPNCNPETECGNGIDYDSDGDIDCDDSDCADNEACLPDPCDKLTGGGYIEPNGSKKNFGVAGGYKNGGYWGHLNFVDTDGDLKVKGLSVTGYEIVDATTRRITGTARINNSSTGTYVVVVSDNGEPNTADTFDLTLSTGYQTGANVTSGNIQLHTQCGNGK